MASWSTFILKSVWEYTVLTALTSAAALSTVITKITECHVIRQDESEHMATWQYIWVVSWVGVVKYMVVLSGFILYSFQEKGGIWSHLVWIEALSKVQHIWFQRRLIRARFFKGRSHSVLFVTISIQTNSILFMTHTECTLVFFWVSKVFEQLDFLCFLKILLCSPSLHTENNYSLNLQLKKKSY